MLKNTLVLLFLLFYRGGEKVPLLFVSGVSSLFHSLVGDGAKIIAPACFLGRWHQKKCPTDQKTAKLKPLGDYFVSASRPKSGPSSLPAQPNLEVEYFYK